MFSVTRDGDKLAGKLTCAKQKDGEDHWSRNITLVKVDLGGGKSSLVVSSVSEGEEEAPKEKRSGWTAGLKLIRNSIDEAVIQGCVKHKVGGDGPSVSAARLADARAVHKRKFINSGDGKSSVAERSALE